jgi:hypothetical protein
MVSPVVEGLQFGAPAECWVLLLVVLLSGVGLDVAAAVEAAYAAAG